MLNEAILKYLFKALLKVLEQYEHIFTIIIFIKYYWSLSFSLFWLNGHTLCLSGHMFLNKDLLGTGNCCISHFYKHFINRVMIFFFLRVTLNLYILYFILFYFTAFYCFTIWIMLFIYFILNKCKCRVNMY